MKILLPFSLFCMVMISACNSSDQPEKQTTSENDLDAARNFIRSALDGKWNDARRFMVQDTTNTELLDTYERNYQSHMNREDKRGYHEASITLYDSRQVNDSVTIVNYSNSYKKKKDSLKVVHSGNQWLVDLKYSFPQTDTTRNAQ